LVPVTAAPDENLPLPPELGDPDLVALAATGDPTALGVLYDRYATVLLAVAFRLLMSRSASEDVVHDVFVGLPEALRRYEHRGAFLSWLKRVTVRVALSRIRREEVRATSPLETTVGVAAPDHEASIDLRVAVASLPPSLRSVLMLKEVEGFSHAEIADLVGISVAASKVRLHRALRALRAMLKDGER
jgi:RNA polymerase sigma factor (sigma-70 family)